MSFNGSAETTQPPLLYCILPHCTYQHGDKEKQRDAPWIISVAAPHDAGSGQIYGEGGGSSTVDSWMKLTRRTKWLCHGSGSSMTFQVFRPWGLLIPPPCAPPTHPAHISAPGRAGVLEAGPPPTQRGP